jgi:hypothetical protein
MLLPASVHPPPPFPLVSASVVSSAFVAPGVRRATYRLTTTAGPLVVNVVAIDLREPSVRFETVVANDRLLSPGETVSGMAARTSAVAGVNADYFDIGQTNQPLNLVVRGGRLLRTPSTRIALTISPERRVRFTNVRFSGSVSDGASRVPLTGIDEFPPQGGASLLLPDYGTLRAAPGVRLAMLESLDGSPSLDGSYRVTAVADADVTQAVRGPMLAFGPAALALGSAPQRGDTLELATQLDPPLTSVASAVGGGPLLVAGGVAVDDPNAPAPEERLRRFPVSGAATSGDGATLWLFAVDGRAPDTSIGLTRPEFAGLMLGFGASDGMAFDSGGSATLVARVLGDERASVLNAPSDGVERPVADGLFVYSDAPRGLHPRLVVRPERFAALPGAAVALRGNVVDDAGNRLASASLVPFVAERTPGPHVAHVRDLSGRFAAEVAYTIVERPARLTIDPAEPNPAAGASLRFRAHGFASDGTPLELGDAIRWGVDAGTIAADGSYRADSGDATVVAARRAVRERFEVPTGSRRRPEERERLGVSADANAHARARTARLGNDRRVARVGRHAQALAFFGAPAAAGWHFEALPHGASGALASLVAGELDLSYDFSGNERAAYAEGDFALPGEPVAFALDVRGDGSTIGLRAAFVNRFGERRALTLAKAVDWSGWKRLTLALPPDLNPPVKLIALYAVPTLGGPSTHAAGTLAFRNPAALLPGAP